MTQPENNQEEVLQDMDHGPLSNGELPGIIILNWQRQALDGPLVFPCGTVRDVLVMQLSAIGPNARMRLRFYMETPMSPLVA